MKILKKRKGFTLVEIMVCCAIIIALSCAAFFGLNQAQQTRKVAQMHSDLEAIATACLVYESLHVNGELPTDIDSLIDTGLAEADSIDGTAHPNLLRLSRADNNTITNPWGEAYTLNTSERTITTNIVSSDGQTKTLATRYF